MAEVFGIVSGAAGLIGLSGQILQGCLFAKSFFDDAKNAPKDVQQILNELEILGAAAEKTRLLFEEVNGSHTTIDDRYYGPPLRQCLHIVTTIGNKLKEVSQKFRAKRPSRWWELMKAATRMNVIKGQLVCLERAKSSLLIVQQNVSIALHQKNETSLRETNTAVRSLHIASAETATKVDQVLLQDSNIAATVHNTDQKVTVLSTDLQETAVKVDQVLAQDTEVMAVVQNTDRNVTAMSSNLQEAATKVDQVFDVVQNTDRSVAGISADLQEVRSQIISQSSTMATAEMADRISTQGTSILATTQETHQTVASMSIGVSHANSQLQSISSAIQSLQNQRGDHTILETMITAAISKALTQHQQEPRSSENNDGQQKTSQEDSATYFPLRVENGRETRRRSRILKRTTYNAGLFKIKVKTVETLFDIVRANSTTSKPGRRVNTTYEIVPNKLFLNHGFIVDYSYNSRLGIRGIQLRTVNFVPGDSPIFKACRAFDVEEVRRLFDCRLASPSDRDGLERSPLEVAFWDSLSLQPKDRDYNTQKENFQKLFQFLIEIGGQSNASLAPIIIARLIQSELEISYAWRTDILRHLLSVTCEDPFHYPGFPDSWDLNASEHPIYNLVYQQDFWYIDLGPRTTASGWFIENDRHIASDVQGLQLKRALLKGCDYEIRITPWERDYWPYNRNHIINNLLRIIADTTRFDVVQGCQKRLVNLLQNGRDPYEIEFPKYLTRFGRNSQRGQHDGHILSPAGLAQELGLGKLWYNTLLKAGMTPGEAAEIFDQEYYNGIPELIDQTRPFLTRDECRAQFLENLVTGKFVSFLEDEIYNETNMLIFNLGIQEADFYPNAVFDMILGANTSFERKSMPGSWVDCKEIRLVPGLDFSWPEGSIRIWTSDFSSKIGIGSWEEILTGQRTSSVVSHGSEAESDSEPAC